MTNAELLEVYTCKKHYERLLGKTNKVINSLYWDKLELENKLHEVSRIKQIYKGVPIGISTNGKYFHTCDDTSYRSAKIYINCRNNTTWGVYLSSSSGNVHDSKCIGNQFTRRQALRIAKDWVALGIKHNN